MEFNTIHYLKSLPVKYTEYTGVIGVIEEY